MKNQCILVLFLLGVVSYAFSETCPPEEDISPCICDEEEDDDIVLSCFEEGTTLEQVRKALTPLSGKKNVHIELDSIDIGILPSNFFNGLHVKRLDISHCELEGLQDREDVPALSGLENSLEELSIVSSFTENNGPAKLKLGHLKWLIEVDLSYNAITEISNEWFELDGYSALERLIISNNNIEKIGDRAFNKLINLRELSLDGNRFGPITRSMLPSSAKYLSSLELDNNAFTSLPEDLFDNMPSLDRVSLRNNGIVRLEQHTWEQVWQQLNVIYLEGNPLECDSRMSWLFDLRKTAAIYGTCRFPRDQDGVSLQDFIDKGQ